jgi:hypothetical protein
MKSVIEILGQILLSISFDIQDSFEAYLCEQYRAFLAMLLLCHSSKSWRERNPSADGSIGNLLQRIGLCSRSSRKLYAESRRCSDCALQPQLNPATSPHAIWRQYRRQWPYLDRPQKRHHHR